MTQMVHLSARIYGRVQGVYFRYFVKDLARQFGLMGYARNLASGDVVEVQVEGNEQQLKKLVEELKKGPPGARVDRVEIIWSEYSGQFTGFGIRF